MNFLPLPSPSSQGDLSVYTIHRMRNEKWVVNCEHCTAKKDLEPAKEWLQKTFKNIYRGDSKSVLIIQKLAGTQWNGPRF